MTDGARSEGFHTGSAGGLPVVTAPAEIEVSNSGQLREALLAALDRSATVIVDLSANTFCDSTAVQALAAG